MSAINESLFDGGNKLSEGAARYLMDGRVSGDGVIAIVWGGVATLTSASAVRRMAVVT